MECRKRGYQTVAEAYRSLAAFRKHLARKDLVTSYCKMCRKWHIIERRNTTK